MRLQLALALKFVYYLDGKKAISISVPDEMSVPLYEEARGD
jgi:hypothetical protein